MKKNNDFNEKMIEKALSEMPVIKDKQSKEEIFTKIQYKMQHSQIDAQKSKKRWLIPSMATVAAVMLFIILVPSLFSSDESMDMTMIENDSYTPEAELMIVSEESAEVAEEMRIAVGDKETDMGMMQENHFIVNEEGYRGAANFVLDGKELVTIALPNSDAQYVVPITVALNNDGRTTLEQLETVFQMLSYEKWGLSSSPLSTFSYSEEEYGAGKKIIIDAPSSSLESISSSEGILLIKSIQETFSALGYELAELSTDGKPGIVLGPYGEETTLQLQAINRGYYLYESHTNHQFLVSGWSVDAPLVNEYGEELSFEETIEQMQIGDAEKGYLASIPSHISIDTIQEEDSLVTISFQEGIVVEDTDETRAMIEAILFTAKDFGYSQVKFEGLGKSVIGDYWLDEMIQVPLAINLVMIE